MKPTVQIIRGNTPEAVHYASVAVVNSEGKLTHYLGDPEMVIVTRSSIKPFQLMPLLVNDTKNRYNFSPKQLAIMCGSHNGSDEHRQVVLENLKAAGNKESDLQCGTHWPLGMQASREYPQNNEDKDVLRHNCSGKHSGFLALAKLLGEDVKDYLNPQSQTQKLAKQFVAEYCEYSQDLMDLSIDGCSAPNFSLPLKNLAVGFMKLASGQSSSNVSSELVKRIRQSIYDFPEMLSGNNRLDLDFMKAFPENIVCKIGAESVEGIGFSSPSIGVAVKIHDGNIRALGAVCVEVFRQLCLFDKIEENNYLKMYKEPEVRNYRKILTGKIVVDFKLERV